MTRATEQRPVLRIAVLVAGLIVSNVVAAALFERDTALGMDDLVTTLAGIGLALLVEFAVFRRDGSNGFAPSWPLGCGRCRCRFSR